MSDKKVIGILGGMGPLATADLFQKITLHTAASCDQDHPRVCIDSNTNISDRTAALLHGGADPVPEMVKSAQRLESIGADLLIMPCNTAHNFYDAVASSVSIPVLHMIAITRDALKSRGAKRAGLLHDIGKAIDHEVEGSHVTIGVNIARKYKESEEVIHAIEAHHNDVEPHTVVACLVQAADAISAARPGARRENIENYVKRLEKLEEVTKSFPGIANCFAIQAGREVRVMVKPDQVSEDQMVILARELAKKIEEEMEYPGQIKVHVLRETTAIEYAK